MAHWLPGLLDTSRPHFELVHSFYKETAARLGFAAGGAGLALDYSAGAAAADSSVRADIEASIAARLRGLSGPPEMLFARLEQTCATPDNLYARVHWCLIDPARYPKD